MLIKIVTPTMIMVTITVGTTIMIIVGMIIVSMIIMVNFSWSTW